MDVADLFENQLNSRLKEDPSLFDESTASYELKIGDYVCHLDLSSEREIKSGPLEDAECRIEIKPETFEKMIAGKANIPMALATRKIKVQGSMLLFAELRKLFT